MKDEKKTDREAERSTLSQTRDHARQQGQHEREIWGTLLPNTLKTRDKGHHSGQSYGNVCARFGELFYQILTKHGRKVEKQTEASIKDGLNGRGTFDTCFEEVQAKKFGTIKDNAEDRNDAQLRDYAQRRRRRKPEKYA